jgi:hypothetical protein
MESEILISGCCPDSNSREPLTTAYTFAISNVSLPKQGGSEDTIATMPPGITPPAETDLLVVFRCGYSGAGSDSSDFAALETCPAKYRTSLGGPEGDGSFASPLGANRRGLNSPGRSAAFGRTVLALGLAGLAPLGLVFEIFFVVKLLLSRSEREIRSAVDAFKCPILKFGHGTILGTKKAERLPFAPPVEGYSTSRRLFFRLRFRARAALTRFFSPGFR